MSRQKYENNTLSVLLVVIGRHSIIIAAGFFAILLLSTCLMEINALCTDPQIVAVSVKLSPKKHSAPKVRCIRGGR